MIVVHDQLFAAAVLNREYSMWDDDAQDDEDYDDDDDVGDHLKSTLCLWWQQQKMSI